MSFRSTHTFLYSLKRWEVSCILMGIYFVLEFPPSMYVSVPFDFGWFWCSFKKWRYSFFTEWCWSNQRFCPRLSSLSFSFCLNDEGIESRMKERKANRTVGKYMTRMNKRENIIRRKEKECLISIPEFLSPCSSSSSSLLLFYPSLDSFWLSFWSSSWREAWRRLRYDCKDHVKSIVISASRTDMMMMNKTIQEKGQGKTYKHEWHWHKILTSTFIMRAVSVLYLPKTFFVLSQTTEWEEEIALTLLSFCLKIFQWKLFWS